MWKPIKPNSTISIISPGSKDPLPGRLDATIKYLENQGFKVNVPKGFCTKPNPFHSADDETRINDLIDALESDSDVIMCYRGGYGSAKVIAGLIKKNYKPRKEKILIGFSDITAIHIFFHEKYGWQPIHGGGPVPFSDSPEKRDHRNITEIDDLIFGTTTEVVINDLINITENAGNNISGRLHGGNLCLVQTTIGTSYQANFKDRIVFLEDCCERGYRIDRMLNHLLDAGLFEGTRALVYGEIVDSNEPKSNESLVMYALKDFAKKINFPVYQSNSFGHGIRNVPLVYGANAVIKNEGDKVSLSYKLIDV